MAVKQIHIEGIGEVSLYKRRGLKSLRLSVQSNGDVRVSVPSYVPYDAAVAFVSSKREWLATHKPASRTSLQNAQAIGKQNTLRFVTSFQTTAPAARLKDNEIIVTHPASLQFDDPAVQAAAESGAIRALRREAEDTLPSRVARIADETGYEYTSVIIKKLKGRWGSCDQDHNIVLNLFLMQLPWRLIDYVILHELVHTRQLHHGEEFWNDFLHHQPDAKLLRKQIRNYQPAIGPTSND